MIKHLKRFAKVSLLFVYFSLLIPNKIGVDRAINISNNFISERNTSKSQFTIKNIEAVSQDDINYFYLIDLAPVGFILVASDDRIIPVLGYSFKTSLDLLNLPSQLKQIIKSYRENINFVLQNSMVQEDAIRFLWLKYENPINYRENVREVEPLISANWNQGGEWNEMCPDNTLVGCVAVAMAQVMYYWSNPIQGNGYAAYYHQDYGPLSVNFEDYNYDFSNMEDSYATPASQLLLYHAGIAVHMNYSYYGSGASVCWEDPSAQDALINNFNFIESTGCHTRINYSDEAWIDLIRGQLDNGWPIIFRAYAENDGPGHAWNIDGYQEGDYLHCNWGWGGSSNGYFYFNNLNGGGYNFVENQAALINIFPQGINPPTALFDYEIDDMYIQFNDLSELINENEIFNWSWDFGDGNFSYDQSPFHTYENFGEYQIQLIVTDNYGLNSESFIETIILQDLTGDLNYDFSVDVIDVIVLINLILNQNIADDYTEADLNQDGFFTILDIVLLLNIILNNSY